ncbi:MAG: ferritin-like domain-containing protein [Candidatus Bathyarchaeota archaeon]|nr:ferritin-like domain-containing protein [Candidatus Bathyarchaeota archaeon]
MVSKELLNLLNQAIAGELQASIQYMWQHIMWRGVKAFAVQAELEKIAIEEMKHAEAIAERLVYLGGTPTVTPAPISIGATLREMINFDREAEENTISLYKRIVKKAEEEGDIVTSKLFRDILKDEESHHDFFTSILEEV